MEDRDGDARRAGDAAAAGRAPSSDLLGAADDLTAAIGNLSLRMARQLKALTERETLELTDLIEHAGR